MVVTMKEAFPGKHQYEGSLHSRDQEHVSLSLKGRMIKLPRESVLSVKLPPPKYEGTDAEIRKLR